MINFLRLGDQRLTAIRGKTLVHDGKNVCNPDVINALRRSEVKHWRDRKTESDAMHVINALRRSEVKHFLCGKIVGLEVV